MEDKFVHPNASPSKDEAHQFALMLNSGMPHLDAIKYFYPDVDERDLGGLLKQWLRSNLVKESLIALQNGKTWQGMSLQEKIEFSVNKHYSEMAYFLFSHNYATLSGNDKLKADTCRQALEAKLAGTAGKMNPLEKFWDDVRMNRISLVPASPTSTIKVGTA